MTDAPSPTFTARSNAAKIKNRNPCLSCQKQRQGCKWELPGQPCKRCAAKRKECEPSRESSKDIVFIIEEPEKSYDKHPRKERTDSAMSTESWVSEGPETPKAYEPSYLTGTVYNEPENLVYDTDGTISHGSIVTYLREPEDQDYVENIVLSSKTPAEVETTEYVVEYRAFADPHLDLVTALEMVMNSTSLEGAPTLSGTDTHTSVVYELPVVEASSAYLGDLDQMQLQLPPSTQSLDASFSGEQSLPQTVNPSLVYPCRAYVDCLDVCIDPRAMMNLDTTVHPMEATYANFPQGMNYGVEVGTSTSTSGPSCIQYGSGFM